ncbi:UNVERIFIED_CONTAM: Outer envelope pore protein 16-4, chloroplastic [Sesamum angustifolium]|uniref:Outer envelope pore protein 16-4, chloroplastic n=2 Tax=Sesamum TaxID=4181 RepID=A0AAE1X7Z0_9LAMI|nr:Outer envelope pore protein 16-4, chloroplastic [Sesamum angolense]
MEEDFSVSTPCSSLAIDSVLRMSSAGVIWGACFGPFDARRLGLSGSARASYIAKTVGQCGFSCGIFAAIFTFTHCGMQRYRQKKDWVNTLAAGALAGAAFGAGTRNWKQVAGITGLFCTLFQFAQDSKSV